MSRSLLSLGAIVLVWLVLVFWCCCIVFHLLFLPCGVCNIVLLGLFIVFCFVMIVCFD